MPKIVPKYGSDHLGESLLRGRDPIRLTWPDGAVTEEIAYIDSGRAYVMVVHHGVEIPFYITGMEADRAEVASV